MCLFSSSSSSFLILYILEKDHAVPLCRSSAVPRVHRVGRGFLSPFCTVPGPWYTKLTSLWIKYQEFTANRRESIHHLHKVYGPVVRLSPKEVSFASLEAIKEIYASGGSGYDKTEHYDLFRQFKIKCATSRTGCVERQSLIKNCRTMFSTLLKDEVSGCNT